MTKRITLIAGLATPERRVRLSKSVTTIKVIGNHSIDFWGWRRERQETIGGNWELLSSSRAILSGGGYRSRVARALYIAWAVSVFFNVLLLGPKRIYCLGLETAAPVWAATRIRRKSKYIFDDADRLVMVWNLPGPIDRFFRWLERRASESSVAHIIPVKELYDFETNKMQLVHNMPTSNQILKAGQINLPPKKDGLVVYVNGTLNETRNMAAILEAAKKLANDPDCKIYFKLATPKRIDGAIDIGDLANVEMLGWLTQDQALAHYRNCDVVLTLLDTKAVQSYKLSWPNKWGDAISMGTPIIVNEDIITSAPFIKNGMALHCPYGDADALVNLLKDLLENPERLKSAKNSIVKNQKLYSMFDDGIRPSLEKLIK